MRKGHGVRSLPRTQRSQRHSLGVLASSAATAALALMVVLGLFARDGGTVSAANIAFRSAQSAGAASGNLTITKPSGTIATDVLIASVAARPSTVTITAPSGWTLVRRTNNTATNSNTLAVYYQIAGASEPASYQWTARRTAASSVASARSPASTTRARSMCNRARPRRTACRTPRPASRRRPRTRWSSHRTRSAARRLGRRRRG